MEISQEYRRNLPHLNPEHGVYFITFRLKNSLPYSVWQKYRQQLQDELNWLSQQDFSQNECRSHYSSFTKNYHLSIDQVIDKACYGKKILLKPEFAEIVKEEILKNAFDNFKLIAYTIMPNHVHLILYKIKIPLFQILKKIKGISAHRINQLQDKRGSIWQKESFDHLIQTRNELADTIEYIMHNPVCAGLTDQWQNWKFNYCREDLIPASLL